MTNEIKLLRAFIEASGFDVEDTQKVIIKGVEHKGKAHEIPVDDLDSMEIINDYKVTKKPDPLRKEYSGVSLEQLVKNIFTVSNLDDGYKFINYDRDQFNAVYDWFIHDVKEKTSDSFLIYGVTVMGYGDDK